MRIKFEQFLDDVSKAYSPNILIIGNGAWFMLSNNSEMISFRENITAMMPIIDELGKHVDVLWTLQDPAKAVGRRPPRVNKAFELYNELLKKVL